MFQQAGTAQLNDYFRPLSERGGSRVFFCRIAGYGETVAAFLRRYYEAARRSGVIIDGRIPNPTPDNLSYFNEMMGSGFQMDRDFLSQRLKKWLPRMTDGQRDAVVTAMYATLDDMRRAGKNDNMLRNAYMKYMCWLYYKFERIVNVLGGETLPKILYAGDVSHYELQLLTVLSRAGADIVLLECGGDQAYLTVDPQSALSHLYQAPGLGPFPAGFGVKQLQAELEREVRRQRLYGTPPSLSPCTNAWVQKAELNAALTAVQARGNDPRFFCNLFLCQYGVEDNLTYTNDLFAFYQSLQGGGRRICVVNGDPAPGGDRRGQAGQLRLRRAAGGGSRRQHPVSGQCGAPAPDDPSFHRSGAGGGGAVRRQRLQAHQPGGVPPVLAEPVSEGPLSGLEGAGGGGLSPVWQMRVGHRSPVPAAAGPPAGGCPVAAPQSE